MATIDKGGVAVSKNFDVQEYMAKGVEEIVKEAIRATFRDPRESAFMAKFALASRKATRLRRKKKKEGLDVPPFLIASITSSCNLHCAGCYSRSNHATVDCKPVAQLTDEEWLKIFKEAQSLGVSFILLAGGEPMLRRGVMVAAGSLQSILFPIFTNGTFMDEKDFDLFDRCRNLVPVMSIEGGKAETDARRGAGVYEKLVDNMDKLHSRGLIYGVSVTVTKENLKQSVSDEFLNSLEKSGCKAVFYIEFVPVTEEGKKLAPDDADRAFMQKELDRLRKTKQEMMFISFPGDEKSSGGCLAAGRGFFHINSHGGAEPCPFSAYSDINVKDTSLEAAINSGLFAALRDGRLLEEDHAGGCVLFEKKAQVEEIMRRIAEEKASDPRGGNRAEG
ncbi:MAG: radical SAM protein [Clostridia bacterium]|nr:radical SAM protein [Clostridia bacterium]